MQNAESSSADNITCQRLIGRAASPIGAQLKPSVFRIPVRLSSLAISSINRPVVSIVADGIHRGDVRPVVLVL